MVKEWKETKGEAYGAIHKVSNDGNFDYSVGNVVHGLCIRAEAFGVPGWLL
jgi:hypothetical protein